MRSHSLPTHPIRIQRPRENPLLAELTLPLPYPGHSERFAHCCPDKFWGLNLEKGLQSPLSLK